MIVNYENSYASSHYTSIVEYDISHAQMICPVLELESSNRYPSLFRKSQEYAKFSLINKHLADFGRYHMDKDEKITKSGDKKLGSGFTRDTMKISGLGLQSTNQCGSFPGRKLVRSNITETTSITYPAQVW